MQFYEILQPYSLDIIAFIWFLLCLYGYSFYSYSEIGKKGSLHEVMNEHRKMWMASMLYRKAEDRLADNRVLAEIGVFATSFVSTCAIVISVLLTILIPFKGAKEVIDSIPFISSYDPILWSLKVLFLIAIFISVIFKQTWVNRQLGDAKMMMLKCPVFPLEDKNQNLYNYHRDQMANIISNAMKHHNIGIRTYYFGFVGITWQLNPIFFMISTCWLLCVIYRREYISKAYEIMNADQPSVLLATNMEKPELPK
jgi:uncharacterized membrane protein